MKRTPFTPTTIEKMTLLIHTKQGDVETVGAYTITPRPHEREVTASVASEAVDLYETECRPLRGYRAGNYRIDGTVTFHGVMRATMARLPDIQHEDTKHTVDELIEWARPKEEES